MNPFLLTLLVRDNPWIEQKDSLGSWITARKPKDFIKRLQLRDSLISWKETHQAHLLIGPRQAGKSTALWDFLSSLGQPFLFLDCEQGLIRDWCQSAPLFLAELEKLLPTPVPLFFEEAQHLSEAGLFLKGLIDRGFPHPIYVSGSSSFHLGARIRESLAGRATRTKLLPFSLAEICQDIQGQPPLVIQRQSRESLERLLVVGGYPRVWLASRPEHILSELIEAVVLRDASDLHKVARPDAFRRLLSLLASQVGSLVNLSEWASLLGISRDTVAAYLEILQTAHLVVMLPPYAGGRRVELTSRPKIFLLDNGMRNHLVNDLRPFEHRSDAGAVLENFVLTELWKALPADATLHHWRSAAKSEVDFVVVQAEKLIGIEVKAAALPRPKLPRSARSFIEAYHPKRFIVLNMALEHQEMLGTTQVQWTTPLVFLKPDWLG